MALKETLLTKSLTSHALDEDELIQLRNESITNLDESTSLPAAATEYLGQSYLIKGIHYVCELVETVPTWVTYNSDGTQLSYADMSDKPTLDGITINGVLTKAALGIAPDSTGRTAITDPSAKNILINDDSLITYENLAAALNTLFDVANLPKYEKQNNPLLSSNGTMVTWDVTHSCKSGQPVIQVYDKNGVIQDSSILEGFTIHHAETTKSTIHWKAGSNIAANEYYVVLIG